jgi:hypothetical protein
LLPTILGDSTIALVWSKAHEDNNRSACDPLAPLVPYPSVHQAHPTPTSSSVTSTGNPLTSQTSTINNVNSPSAPHPLVPDSLTQCRSSVHTMHQMNRPMKHPSSFHLTSAHPRPCLYRPAQCAPPSSPRRTSTTVCYKPSPMGYYKPSPTRRQVLAWRPNDMKIVSTTWSSEYSTTRQPSTSRLRASHSTMGRLLTSRSQSARDYIRRQSGYASMTTALSRATTGCKACTTSPTPSTYTLLPTIASAPPLNPYLCGSDTCSPVLGATSKSCRTLWPTPETGVLPERSRDTANSMTTSQLWPSRSKSTNATWMLPMHALDAANPDSCLRAPQNGSQLCRMCRGKWEPYGWAEREVPTCLGASTYVPHHWKTSRMYRDVHRRAEGDVTGLGAATRAGTHVSCATRQGSVII